MYCTPLKQYHTRKREREREGFQKRKYSQVCHSQNPDGHDQFRGRGGGGITADNSFYIYPNIPERSASSSPISVPFLQSLQAVFRTRDVSILQPRERISVKLKIYIQQRYNSLHVGACVACVFFLLINCSCDKKNQMGKGVFFFRYKVYATFKPIKYTSRYTFGEYF